jgi:octanoyl-[GcvH]:protein N-octanoyltransferase
VEDAVIEAYRGYAEIVDGDFRSLVG